MTTFYPTYYCPKCKFATARAICSCCGGPVSYKKPPQEEIEIAQYKQLLDNKMLQAVHSAKFQTLQAKIWYCIKSCVLFLRI